MSSANATCYNEDGTVSSDIPCGFSSILTCCGAGWDCLSNGLCRRHGTTGYSQGTCSDPGFQNCLSFCNQRQFQGYTEVSRCDANGNNWCCAGAAGQGLGGLECCSTNLTTALEPYPFAAVDRSGQPSSVARVATTVVLPSTTLTPGFLSSSSLSSSSTSTPNSLSTPSTSQSSTTAIPPTAPTTASPQPASKTPNSTLGLEIGVPLAVIILLLASLAVFLFRRNRKQKRNLAQVHGTRADDQPDVHQLGEDGMLGELDVTRWELTQANAGRWELPHDAQRHELL